MLVSRYFDKLVTCLVVCTVLVEAQSPHGLQLGDDSLVLDLTGARLVVLVVSVPNYGSLCEHKASSDCIKTHRVKRGFDEESTTAVGYQLFKIRSNETKAWCFGSLLEVLPVVLAFLYDGTALQVIYRTT